MEGDRSAYVARALARKQQHEREAQNDVNAFIEYCLVDKDGAPVKQGAIHREWQALGDRYKSLMILGSKQHGKSFQATARAMYKLGRDPNELIKIVCSSDRKGTKRMQTIRKNVEDNDILHRVFPVLHPRRIKTLNKKQLYLHRSGDSNEPSVEAIGITSSATGDRATGLIPDDAVDQRNSVMQPKMRETIRNAWGDWYSLLVPEGWMFWISNLWHNLDLTHELMANEAYAVARYEIDTDTLLGRITTPDGVTRQLDTPLWPEYWTIEKLRTLKRKLKARSFARLFSLRPLSVDKTKVREEWLIPWDDPDRGTGPPGDDWDRIMVLDLAESQEIDADMIGIAEAAVCRTSPRIKITDLWHTKIDFDDKIRLLKEQHREHHYTDIVLEQSAGGLSLYQHAVNRYRLPVRLIPVGGKRKGIWLDEAVSFLKAGVIEFDPWLLDNTGEMGERGDGIAEILNFGSYPTDDILDAFTRLVFYVTSVYESFDGLAIDDDDDLSPRSADHDDEDYDDLDDDCEVILV